MKDRILCTVDMGASRTAAMAFDGCSERLEPLALAISPSRGGMSKGEVVDPDKAAESLHEAMEQIEKSLGTSPDGIILNVSSRSFEGTSSQGYVPIFPKGRTITRDDVLQVINHSRQAPLPGDKEQVQAIPREFKLDGEGGVMQPVGKTGSKLEVVTYIAVADKSALSERSRAVALAGLKTEQMLLGPMASALGVLTAAERASGTVCVDIGASKTDVAIFVHGGLGWSDTIPVGSHHVSLDLATLLKTTPEEGERLKVRFGAASAALAAGESAVEVLQIGQSGPRPLAQKVLCEIIESRMREIANLVSASVAKSGIAAARLSGCVITGGGSHLRGTDSLFAKETGFQSVRVGGPTLSLSDFQASSDAPPGSLSGLVGAAYFAHTDEEDELAPASGPQSISSRMRTLWTNFSGGSN